MLYLAIIFALVGAVLIALGVRQLVKAQRWRRHASRAKGVVWEMIVETGIELDRSYHPRIAFRAADKRRYYFKSAWGSGSARRWKVGDEVDVLYDPEHPETARIAHSVPLFAIPG